MWLLFIALLSGAAFCFEMDSYDYDNNLDANNDQLTSNVYILPKQIFNDGKPFYVKKDPISGTLNFNVKTTPAEPVVSDDDAAIPATSATLTTTNGRRGEKRNGTNASADVKHDISVKASTQNIHDYLNLPVKYSSSKFVYPLVSSSYANLKYQGNNKNYISNHKYDSTTLRSVPVTVNNYKKYKTPYPTKAHYYGSSSSLMPKNVSNTATPASATLTNTFESTTKLTPVHSERPHVNDMPAAPRPSYTTIGHKDRMNNTIIRDSTPSAMRPIVVPSENRVERENATQSSKPTAPPKTTSGKEQTEGDSMNFGDLFNYFFDSEDNEATEPNEEGTVKKDITATTRVPSITTQHPYNRRTTVDLARNASVPTTTTVSSSFSTVTPTKSTTASATTTWTTTPTTTRIPSTHTLKQEQHPNSAGSPSVNRNSGQFQDQSLPFNGHGTNFHPPASSEMSNIVVAPGSHTASFVATGQLSTGNNNFDRRPIADASYRPAPVNDIVTGSIAMKGQVSDAFAQKQQQHQVNFHVPASNMNNIVVAPGSQTASFITSSQLAMDAATPDVADSENGESQVNEQQIKNTMNAISVYDTIKLSTQIPQGFTLLTTTSRPPSTTGVQMQQTSAKPHRIRFPAERTDAPPAMLTLQQQQQQLHQNNSIKFPATQNSAAEAPTGHVKLDTRNEIYDRNNYKQIVKHPLNVNRVIFERPQSQLNSVEQSNAMASAQAPPFNPNFHSPPFNFKQPTFIQYPRKNLTLPNILPQFRPNTQLPTMDAMNQLRPGHFNRPQQFSYGGQNVRFKPPMHYHQYGGIRTKTPLLMPTGHLPQLPIDQSHNRRHFELHQVNVNQFNNRIFDRALPQHLLHRNIERNVLATQAPVAAAVIVDDQQYDESSAKVGETHVAVESNEAPKVEPVTTLQQIQQQRLLHKQPSIVDAVVAASENNENHVATKTNNSQLYVVYPVPEAATTNIQHTIPNKATTTISTQPHNFPYALEKSQRFILNTRPSNEFDEKSDRIYERPEIAAESDERADDG